MSAAAVCSLALGIAGTTAVFSLIDGLLLRPLPSVGNTKSLVAMVGVHLRDPARRQLVSYADYRAYASRRDVVHDLAAFADCDVSLAQHGRLAERVPGLAVSGSYFEVLRLVPTLGRLLEPADEHSVVAVLGFSLWRRQFGGDLRAIGAAVTLNGKSVTVVGVAPPGFAGTDLRTRREIWVPLGAYSNIAAGVLAPFTGRHDRSQEWLNVLGRLAPGCGLIRAQAALQGTARSLAAAWPATNRDRGIELLPLAEATLGGMAARTAVRAFATRLMAVVAAVLAVVTMNLGGWLLARSLARRKEIAIRISLGASRGRLLAQLLVEGLVLAALGGGTGIVLARTGRPLLRRIELPLQLGSRDFLLSERVLAFALLVSLASCLLFSLGPALQALRRTPLPLMHRESMFRVHSGRIGLREALAGLQVATAFLILVAAGLLGRSLLNLESIPPGFDPARVLVATVDLAPTGRKGLQVDAFYDQVLARLRSHPDVLNASMVSALPVMGADIEVSLDVSPVGVTTPPAAAGAARPSAVFHVLVGSHYFPTVGMRILRGRDFGDGDTIAAPGVVILNQAAARLLWPGEDALGRQVRLVQTGAPFSVVGVVSDSTYASLKEDRRPILYLSHAQSAKSFIGELLAPQMTFLVHTTGSPWTALGPLREAVRRSDPDLPVFQVATLGDLLSATIGVEHQAAVLYGGLALVSVGLAMLGLFSVLSLTVTEQTREIGVRIVCGATPANIWLRLVLRSTALSLAGVGAGAAVALPAHRIVSGILYRVDALDPTIWCLSLGAVVGLGFAVSAAAGFRAALIDPVSAMKQE